MIVHAGKAKVIVQWPLQNALSPLGSWNSRIWQIWYLPPQFLLWCFFGHKIFENNIWSVSLSVYTYFIWYKMIMNFENQMNFFEALTNNLVWGFAILHPLQHIKVGWQIAKSHNNFANFSVKTTKGNFRSFRFYFMGLQWKNFHLILSQIFMLNISVQKRPNSKILKSPWQSGYSGTFPV